MKQNAKKTRPSAGTPERAKEPGTNYHESLQLYEECTTAAAVRQIQISDFLSYGQENAVSLRHLEQLTGIPGRYLRRRIQAERLSGVPILADCKNGYFLPTDDAERRRFVQSMRGRAKEIEAVAAAVEGAEV